MLFVLLEAACIKVNFVFNFRNKSFKLYLKRITNVPFDWSDLHSIKWNCFCFHSCSTTNKNNLKHPIVLLLCYYLKKCFNFYFPSKNRNAYWAEASNITFFLSPPPTPPSLALIARNDVRDQITYLDSVIRYIWNSSISDLKLILTENKGGRIVRLFHFCMNNE